MKLQILTLCLATLGACGGTPYGGDDAPGVDGSPDGDGGNGGGPVTVTVKTHLAPKLVAYRQGTGSWSSAFVDERGEFQLDVAGPYEVVVVCGKDLAPPLDGSEFDTQIVRATPSDGPVLSIWCQADPPPASSPGFRITGQMAQAGRIALDHTDAQSASAPWQFTVHARPGFHDLVASDDNRVLIKRDLFVIIGRDIGTIDLAQGHALVPTQFVLQGLLPDDSPTDSMVVLEVPSAAPDGDHDQLLLGRGPAGSLLVKLAPPQALTPGDRQLVSVSTHSARTYRSVTVTDGSTHELVLPPRLTDFEVTPTGASWSAANGEGDYTMRIASNVADRHYRAVALRATQSWLAGATEVHVELEIPRFETRWMVDPANVWNAWGPELSRAQRTGGIENVSVGDLL